MDCPPALTPKGSPLIIRLVPKDPPPLSLSVQERTQAVATQLAPSQNNINNAFTAYFVQYLNGPFSMAEAKKMIAGDNADYYRSLAVKVLASRPREAYEFAKEISNAMLRASCFQDIAKGLCTIDAFDCLKEGFTFLERSRADLCKLAIAFQYLEANNIGRTFQLYTLICNLSHRRNLFTHLYSKTPVIQDRLNLIYEIVSLHFDRSDTEEAIFIIKNLCPDVDAEEHLFAMGRYLAEKNSRDVLKIIQAMSPSQKREELITLAENKSVKRKVPEPQPKTAPANPSDQEKLSAFNSLCKRGKHQQAFFFAREIADPARKEACLSSLVNPLVLSDEFATLKILFPYTIKKDDLKLQAAILYASKNVSRSIELFLSMTSHAHRVRLFNALLQKAKTPEEVSAMVEQIVNPFIQNGHVELALNILKTQLPGINVGFEIYRMGQYLIGRGSLEKIYLVLNELTEDSRGELAKLMLNL